MSKWSDQAAACRSAAGVERECAAKYRAWAEAPETLERHRARYLDLANDCAEKAGWFDDRAELYDARHEEWEAAQNAVAA